MERFEYHCVDIIEGVTWELRTCLVVRKARQRIVGFPFNSSANLIWQKTCFFIHYCFADIGSWFIKIRVGGAKSSVGSHCRRGRDEMMLIKEKAPFKPQTKEKTDV